MTDSDTTPLLTSPIPVNSRVWRDDVVAAGLYVSFPHRDWT